MREKLKSLLTGLIILLLILAPIGFGCCLGWLCGNSAQQKQEIKTEETIMSWRISALKYETFYREQLKRNENLINENIRLQVNQDVLVLRLEKYEWVDKNKYR